LAIPVIGGAALLELIDQRSIDIDAQHAVLGIVLSFGVGYLALSILVKMLDRGRLHWFAYWLIPFGLAVVVWQLNEMVQSSLEARP
jgi:undecaprenyl-diphosphatase